MSSIVNLHDNCLLKIVEHLDLEEQLHLFQATESISRLNKVIARCWQLQNRHSLNQKICGDSIELLLQRISATVVELKLHSSIYDLGDFRKYSFPLVRALEYSREESSVDDIEALVNCFPLIETLKITEIVTGASLELCSAHHVAKWEHLSKLDIIAASRHWKTKCFQEICQKLPLQFLSVAWRESEEDAYVEAISKLKELEELHLELDYLSKENTSKLLALPKLRRLRFDEFEDVEQLLENIHEIKGDDVVALTCNENFWLWLTPTPNHFRNVQKLCIVNEGVVEGMWCASSFNETIKEFSSLLEFYLEDTTIWGTGAEFWEMISYCPQLHLLHLRNYGIEDEFLEFSESIMIKALSHRKDPLVIHFVNTHREDLIIERLNHPKLELSFKSIKNAFPNLSGGLLELEFKHLTS